MVRGGGYVLSQLLTGQHCTGTKPEVGTQGGILSLMFYDKYYSWGSMVSRRCLEEMRQEEGWMSWVQITMVHFSIVSIVEVGANYRHFLALNLAPALQQNKGSCSNPDQRQSKTKHQMLKISLQAYHDFAGQVKTQISVKFGPPIILQRFSKMIKTFFK